MRDVYANVSQMLFIFYFVVNDVSVSISIEECYCILSPDDIFGSLLV